MANDYERALLGLVERGLKSRGLDLKARYVGADDESMDDEITLSSADGTGLYPVAIQLGSNYMGVSVTTFDSNGEFESVSHGELHPRLTGKLLDELTVKLKSIAPRPIAEPARPGI